MSKSNLGVKYEHAENAESTRRVVVSRLDLNLEEVELIREGKALSLVGYDKSKTGNGYTEIPLSQEEYNTIQRQWGLGRRKFVVRGKGELEETLEE